jgi:hypothetical protein
MKEIVELDLLKLLLIELIRDFTCSLKLIDFLRLCFIGENDLDF